jgi:hypothetical protein
MQHVFHAGQVVSLEAKQFHFPVEAVFSEMRADEARDSGYQYFFHKMVLSGHFPGAEALVLPGIKRQSGVKLRELAAGIFPKATGENTTTTPAMEIRFAMINFS